MYSSSSSSSSSSVLTAVTADTAVTAKPRGSRSQYGKTIPRYSTAPESDPMGARTAAPSFENCRPVETMCYSICSEYVSEYLRSLGYRSSACCRRVTPLLRTSTAADCSTTVSEYIWSASKQCIEGTKAAVLHLQEVVLLHCQVGFWWGVLVISASIEKCAPLSVPRLCVTECQLRHPLI